MWTVKLNLPEQRVLVLHLEGQRSRQTDLFLSYHQVPAKMPANQAELILQLIPSNATG